ncbi:MAG: hypothetical protein PVF43_13000 [Candidatus Eiseniibacteriota bacterium]|jgi:hypothetical protein
MNFPRWIRFDWPGRLPFWFVLCLALCVGALAANYVLSDVESGNLWSLGFGAAALAFMLGALLYGARRRTMRWGAGRTRAWLQFHIYGGILFLLLMLMHSAFQVPDGKLNQWIWGLSLWITASGLLGAIIQRWVPRVITSGLTVEAHYDRIPDLIGDIRQRAQALLATCDDPVQDFYHLNLETAFAGPQPRFIYFMDVTGGIQSRTRGFPYLLRILPADQREKLAELEAFFRTKLELDAQYTLQRALRWWLYLHVPVSMALLVLVAVHVYIGLTY